MRFGLSEEQQMLQQSVRGVLQRMAEEGGKAPSADAEADYRRQLAQLGAQGILCDAAAGGLGLGLLEAVLVGEELGRACAPCSWHALGVGVPLALSLATDSPKLREARLPGLLQGEVCAGLALSHQVASRDDAGIAAAGGKLTGRTLMASDCPGADFWLVAAEGALYLVEGDAAGLKTQPMGTIDAGRRFGRLQLDGVQASPLEPNGALSLERLLQAVRIALAAEMLGAADHMLDRAVQYASEREQFGRTIASFQAIKHLCAEMAAELEPNRSLLWYAAYCWDQQSDETAMLSRHLKAATAEAAQFVARTATEVHGGIGFTAEYGMHSWFKRIGVNRQLLGGPERMRAEAARIQGLTAQSVSESAV